MNYKDCCRTCLSTNKEMRKLDSVVNISGIKVQISDILLKFYRFQASADDDEFYPDNVCIDCVHHLTLTHSFKLLIESSTKTLLETVALNNVMDDVDDDDDDTNDSIPKIYHGKVSRQKKLIQHKVEPETQIFCVECKSEFHTKELLKEHCKLHPVKCEIGLHDCQLCPEKFSDYKELAVHKKLHQKPFLCITCWGGFLNESEYVQHVCKPQPVRTHNPRLLSQCDQCGKSYPKGYIKYHIASHGEEYKFSCKLCPKKFKLATCLYSHMQWNHKKTRDFKCDECDATFVTASSRSVHIRKDHLHERRYGCETCPKRFFTKAQLEKHLRTHTGAKDFQCALCFKSYQSKYGLSVHIKSLHGVGLSQGLLDLAKKRNDQMC